MKLEIQKMFRQITFYSFRGFSFLALGADVALAKGVPYGVPETSPWPKIRPSPRLFLPPNSRGVTPSGNGRVYIWSKMYALSFRFTNYTKSIFPCFGIIYF